MSDDFDGDIGESDIPEDMDDVAEERVQEAIDDRIDEVYEDARPRSGGCLLILALPALALWLLR